MLQDDPIADLLSRIAAQDRAALSELYAATSAKLMGVMIRMLRDRAEAEDAVQEVFIRIWLRAGRYDPAKGRGMTWMIAVARNLALDRLRRRTEDQAPEHAAKAIVDPSPTAESRLIAMGEAGRVADCFDQLEPEKAQALRGAYLSGLSYVALSERHKVPLNTMRTWLRRGLISLKECLDK